MSKEFKFKNLPKEFTEKLKALKDEFSLLSNPTPVVVPVPAPIPAPAVFGEGELEDGSRVKWEGDTLTVGAPLMIIDPSNPDGYLPAPDGEYKMKDGTVIKVTEGKISEIVPVAPVMPPAPEAQSQIPAMVAQMAELKENFSKVSKDKEALESQFSKKFEDTNRLLKEVFELVSQMAEAPVADPVVTPVVTPSVKLSHAEKIKKLYS